MTTALLAIAFKAQTHPKHRFQNLYGLLDSDLLVQSWCKLNKQSAPWRRRYASGRAKKAIYEKAKRLHPKRWSGETRNWKAAGAVSLNPGKPQEVERNQAAA